MLKGTFRNNNSSIAVTVTPNAHPNKTQQAKQIADHLHLPFINVSAPAHDQQFDYLLVFTETYIGLKQPGTKSLFRIDFTAGRLRYRSIHATRRNELLARAMGSHPQQMPHVVDATAGFGRDSFILASLGFSVILLERAPLIHLLLADAIGQARLSPLVAPIMSRLNLIHVDAVDWLKDKQTEIVYLDPMFPERQKSASVKKESLILRDLLPFDEMNHLNLFDAALACATKRVVIKRPRLSGNMTNQKPSFSLHGNSCRFDVYLVG